MNKNIIIILLVMITSIVGQFRPEERNSNPKLMIKWKMTEFLDISEKQAETFFPRVNAMEKENVNRGLASFCIGGGEASAMIVEKI